MRAVGAANGKNPLSIVVPCHRVIGSDGSLTGYGGGMRNKEYLLALEGTGTGNFEFRRNSNFEIADSKFAVANTGRQAAKK